HGIDLNRSPSLLLNVFRHRACSSSIGDAGGQPPGVPAAGFLRSQLDHMCVAAKCLRNLLAGNTIRDPGKALARTSAGKEYEASSHKSRPTSQPACF
ncbi:MAG TPA: hypothetical protein VGA66_02020, partial [Mycobacterium sp.]